MNSGDKLIYDGYEVLLYPTDYINITADPSASNHTIIGVSNSGLWDNGWYQTPIKPLYAPCTMRLVASYPTGQSAGHAQLWVSVNPVWVPQYNEPVFVSFSAGHSDTLYYQDIGTVIKQGTHFYDTGTFGYVTGAHTHYILAFGTRESMFPTGRNAIYGATWYSPNPPINIATYFYITGDEVLVNTRGLTFNKFEGGVTPPLKSNAILYTILNKIRRRYKNGEGTIFI